MNVSPSDDVASHCHRILTREIGSTRVEERFRLDTRTKEVMNPREVLRMFEQHRPRKIEGLLQFSRMISPIGTGSTRFHYQ